MPVELGSALTPLSLAALVVIALAVYYLLSPRAQNYWLLALSYFLYAALAWQFAAILLGVTAVNFLIAPRLRDHNRPQRAWLWFGIGLNVLALAIFKYAD